MEATIETKPLSPLESKLFERAQDKLRRDIEEMQSAIGSMTNKLDHEDKFNVSFKLKVKGEPVSVDVWQLGASLGQYLQTKLLPDYYEREVNEFLSQVDSVARLSREHSQD